MMLNFMFFFCVLEDGSIGPEMELKHFRHYPKKQNQSQGTSSDKHLLKPRAIYWFEWHAVHLLSIKSMWQISHAEHITSSKVCTHSARICNQMFMIFFLSMYFFLCILNMGVCKYLFVCVVGCTDMFILHVSVFVVVSCVADPQPLFINLLIIANSWRQKNPSWLKLCLL